MNTDDEIQEATGFSNAKFDFSQYETTPILSFVVRQVVASG